ncbi:MAG TPA: hypothetical protein VK628_05230 [Flavitalea sp.]|nr:hypothetical protein [Flavitalea sp.]
MINQNEFPGRDDSGMPPRNDETDRTTLFPKNRSMNSDEAASAHPGVQNTENIAVPSGNEEPLDDGILEENNLTDDLADDGDWEPRR